MQVMQVLDAELAVLDRLLRDGRYELSDDTPAEMVETLADFERRGAVRCVYYIENRDYIKVYRNELKEVVALWLAKENTK